jgi:hypothetical protein
MRKLSEKGQWRVVPYQNPGKSLIKFNISGRKRRGSIFFGWNRNGLSLSAELYFMTI